MASNGQLGLGLTGDQVSPIQIVKWPRTASKTQYTGEENQVPFVGVVACGARHSCAVDRLGRLYTWGGSGGCMLGIPTDLAVDVSAVRHTSIRGRLQPNATKVELSTQSMGSNDASLYGGRNESVAAEAAEVAEAAVRCLYYTCW
jgi:alpha-tubulin suppressor-like RCC1 family protein